MPEVSHDATDALTRVMTHGRTATAFRGLGADLRRWITSDGTGMVAFASPPGAHVAAGEPVAAMPTLVAVAEAFVQAAAAQRKRASFFATEGRLAAAPSLQRRLLGEQPAWDPRAWDAHVRSHRSLREQIRRARAKGVRVRALSAHEVTDPPMGEALQALVRRWRATRGMAPMAFLVTVDLTAHAMARRTFVAEHDGHLAGVLSLAPAPARGGWVFEHLLRDPDAPNGSAELLVDHAMRALAAEQVSWATLGLAPLHGPVSGWLRVLRHWSKPLFNFEGLAHFKRKLRPQVWEPIYLAWPRGEPGWRALLDGLRAFAGGSLWAFGVRTLLRGPAPVLHALEWALVPWMLLLAVAPTRLWFPGVTVQAAWLLFDGALLIALRTLRTITPQRGPRARSLAVRLATALAVAVSADAVLTAWQALAWNAPRVEGGGAWVVIALACAAPALAAVVLWGARARLRTLVAPRPHVRGSW